MSSTDAREQRAGGAAEEQDATGGGVGAAPPARAGGHVAGGYRPHRFHRGRWIAAGVVVVLAGAGAGSAVASGVFSSKPGGASGSSGNTGYPTSTSPVIRGPLTSQSVVDATLGDAGTWSVVVPQSSASASASASAGGSASGTITWLPRVGRTVYQGQRIYAVSGTPVVLLYGNIPSYRDLSEGMTGADVTELNRALVKLGYATRAALGPRSGWDYYSSETAYAVERLQARMGLTQTGTLSLGEVAFLPGPALITAWGSATVVGSPATPGTVVVTASSTRPVVTIALDAGQQSEVKVGDPVSITLPNGRVTPGVVSQISRVASSASSSGAGSSANAPGGSGNGSGTGATITVLATLKHPKAAGRLNSAPVTVTITTASVSNVLSVPVNALLAQPGGGYAVEVTGPGGHHLVKVTAGPLFDDAAGRVQVTGNLTPGQRVVVPGI